MISLIGAPRGSLYHQQALPLATLIVSSIEGAVVLSRAQRSTVRGNEWSISSRR